MFSSSDNALPSTHRAELLPLIQGRLWPLLGLTLPMHAGLVAWVHVRQFLATGAFLLACQLIRLDSDGAAWPYCVTKRAASQASHLAPRVFVLMAYIDCPTGDTGLLETCKVLLSGLAGDVLSNGNGKGRPGCHDGHAFGQSAAKAVATWATAVLSDYHRYFEKAWNMQAVVEILHAVYPKTFQEVRLPCCPCVPHWLPTVSNLLFYCQMVGLTMDTILRLNTGPKACNSVHVCLHSFHADFACRHVYAGLERSI